MFSDLQFSAPKLQVRKSYFSETLKTRGIKKVYFSEKKREKQGAALQRSALQPFKKSKIILNHQKHTLN